MLLLMVRVLLMSSFQQTILELHYNCKHIQSTLPPSSMHGIRSQSQSLAMIIQARLKCKQAIFHPSSQHPRAHLSEPLFSTQSQREDGRPQGSSTYSMEWPRRRNCFDYEAAQVVPRNFEQLDSWFSHQLHRTKAL